VEYLTETEGFIKKKAKANFIALGKKLGAKMKPVAAAIAAFGQHEIATIEKEGVYALAMEGETVYIKLEELDISTDDIPGWKVASKGALTVALDVTVTGQLQKEGYARELINRVQNIRKDMGLALTDRILVTVSNNNELLPSLTEYNAYICAEILADKLEVVPGLDAGLQVEISDFQLFVNVNKIAD
jgi:isoleucyl-tRNA synthetase